MNVYSKRGYLLAGLSELNSLDDRTVLTVELADKWYGLQLVRPDLSVEEIPFPTDLHPDGPRPAYVDHVPNPLVVRGLALKRGYSIPDLADELMVGRWMIEAIESVYS